MNRVQNLRQRYREAAVETHQRRMNRLHRALPHWRDRRHRRPLVVTCAITVLVSTAMAIAVGPAPSAAYLIWLAITLVWVWQWIVLRLITSGISESSTLVLDERETALRDRATRYGFLAAMMLNGALTGALGARGFEPVGAVQLSLIIASATLICGTVPVGFLAWTLPDDDPEDLLDDVEADRDAETDHASSVASGHAQATTTPDRSPAADIAAEPTTDIPSTEGQPAAEPDSGDEPENERNGGGQQ
ncbi:hypothetical protein [Actinoalloteichus hymeniacidonis]|uniref:Uncharacterized protein n=1 Tax=Actinoalloteichus hymeniacidonis TaxID=340345 RepID=A0AAC9HWJ6_9PSEU|nr:hypothetical protein [Actinoalloteichus hymeniacidonis]AOS65795.1 hypothetical protein TL08_25085 [Actinoalloteichus hymeniacidonis]MBB5906114.1 hypothetical protein [Actinoalloteichus hymeniacidonis]